jgi:hypothetical protein
MSKRVAIAMAAALGGGCHPSASSSAASAASTPSADLAASSATAASGATTGVSEPGPVVSRAHLGQQITVEGSAANAKLGAMLMGEGFTLWIDGLDRWPEGFYLGGDRGKRLRVTGVLGEDHGLPVFVQRAGEPVPQGIPVPEGTDLERASQRFVLKGARWTLLD